ncbi:hypothetical protein LOD99_7578 [Oopsacas minuta]|uniref:Uncharacterized protein n=1 Tax=Oopsacas minuta TaxID=111878 RepID=A0AAV7JP57_9METZ|nr:hypothetical protein LOD99_7578 [Oopsacas minuta]
MTERNPNAPQFVNSIETQINNAIDGLIELLNVRRADLMEQVNNILEEKRTAEIARQQMIIQLTNAQTSLQSHLKENPLKFMQERIVREMEDKMRDLRMNIETQLRLQCDTREIETIICRMGESYKYQLLCQIMLHFKFLLLLLERKVQVLAISIVHML